VSYFLQGSVTVDVHVAPGYGPWKQTSSRSMTVWTQPGDSLRTEDDGSNLWKWLRSSQGHARDDDDDECNCSVVSVVAWCSGTVVQTRCSISEVTLHWA